MVWIVAGLWLLAGCLRIYRFARFFQIEEYQNVRFFHWLQEHRERWQWRRPVIAVSAALVISFVMMEAGMEWPLVIVHGVAAIVAMWPTPEKEVKKQFVRTQRATRLLVLSWLAYAVIWLIGVGAVYVLVHELIVLYPLVAVWCLLLFLLAPLFLIDGNILAIPVEAGMRRMYLRRARGVLRQQSPTVIGITGSYGKTSTKHYLSHILNGRYHTVATPKSYNTLMGVTLAINTVLKEESNVDYFLVEMGAYIEGEIAEICELAQPQMSIVTAVGPQHLERFGSIEAVAKAKFEIVAALPPDGVAFLNGDDPNVRAMADKAAIARTVLVSAAGSDAVEGDVEAAGFVAHNINETIDGLTFEVEDVVSGEIRRFHAPLFGVHNVANLLLATAVARHIGLSLGEIAMRVAGVEPFEHRLQRRIHPGGLIVLDDAYSANPVGAVSALQVLGLHKTGKRILITPGMVELGDVEAEENRLLGERAADFATHILLVGIAQTKPIYEGVTATTFDQNCLHVYDTHAEAVAWMRENAQAGDVVLFLNDLPDTYL